MERATGIGGVFFRARGPAELSAWYEQHLGITCMDEDGEGDVWWQDGGPTVFAPFASESDYFGNRDQQVMLNFRVDDLDAMLTQLRDAGVTVDDRVEVMDGIGRFGWATDPEGTRFELWEPASQALERP